MTKQQLGEYATSAARDLLSAHAKEEQERQKADELEAKEAARAYADADLRAKRQTAAAMAGDLSERLTIQ